MPSLVDPSIFMQAILCMPQLRKGLDEKAQKHDHLHFTTTCHYKVIL